MHAPLWTIDDHDDGIDEHCDNCGQPSPNIVQHGRSFLCPKCLKIHRELVEQNILDVNLDDELDKELDSRYGAPDDFEAPDTLIVNPPFRSNMLNQAHDILDDK